MRAKETKKQFQATVEQSTSGAYLAICQPLYPRAWFFLGELVTGFFWTIEYIGELAIGMLIDKDQAPNQETPDSLLAAGEVSSTHNLSKVL